MKKSLNLELKKQFDCSTPLPLLKKWLKEAQDSQSSFAPWAMILSTSLHHKPSSRVVLLKGIQKESLIFFTNYASQKGKAIQKNPFVSCTFYWNDLGRQIHVRGKAKKMSRAGNLKYWKTRPRDSQLSQWVSKQSTPIKDRKTLEALRGKANQQFRNKAVPCPPHWGGYHLFILEIEFWQERNHRLHDRFLFQRKAKKWKIQRLFP